MNFKIELNNFLVDVELQNKKNIKHCYLRVLSDNLIQIKANRYFTILDAKDLIYRKKDWLIENIQKQNSKKLKENEFLYFGEKNY